MKKITMQIQRREGNTDLPLPKYMSDGSSGMDVYAATTGAVALQKGERALIPTGISVAVPKGYEVQVRPRSGLAAKHGISIVNAPGTIDSDYRGEVKVILMNLGDEEFVVERGMRIAQLVVQPVFRAEIEEVEELGDTARGEGGFGHSGV